MFFNTITYFKFLLKSQNQHGLHSPFVYDFVTKGLYNKKIKTSNFNNYTELKNLSKKQLKITSKILKYFKIDSLYFDFSSFIEASHKNYKVLFIENLNLINKINFSTLSSKHFILVNGIYNSKKSYQEWQNIVKNKHITASIDLYYFGLIFFRKEQAKEHFMIRA